MTTFAWLLAAGVVWLILVQTSELLSFPPQLVTLARSSYLGTFAILMMIELRRDPSKEVRRTNFQGVSAIEFIWMLAPLGSLGVLVLFSTDLAVTPRTISTAIVFYVCQLSLLFFRARLGQMRNAAWDLAPPFVLAFLLLNLPAMLVAAAIAIGGILRMLDSRSSSSRDTADSLVMQLPSLCLAPVVLIALRDVFDFGGTIARAHVESFGMIVNGLGAATWTAFVMRASKRLALLAAVLWGIGTVIASFIMTLSSVDTVSVIAIVAAEVFRGSLWLGTTHILKSSSRWSGFAVNVFATALPLACLWLARLGMELQAFVAVYAAVHVVVPLGLWAYSHWRKL